MTIQTQQSARKSAPSSRASVQSLGAIGANSTAEAVREPVTIQRATAAFLEPEKRCAMIAEAAYYLAECRREREGRAAIASGHEQEDWLAAEAEIDDLLMRGQVPVALDR